MLFDSLQSRLMRLNSWISLTFQYKNKPENSTIFINEFLRRLSLWTSKFLRPLKNILKLSKYLKRGISVNKSLLKILNFNKMTEEARKSTENGDDKRASLGGKGKPKYSDNILPMVSTKMI